MMVSGCGSASCVEAASYLNGSIHQVYILAICSGFGCNLSRLHNPPESDAGAQPVHFV